VESEDEQLRTDLARATGLEAERLRRPAAEQRVAALAARVDQQAKTLNDMAQGLIWLRARVRAVAHDPVHGPAFRAALDDVLSRPGWEPGAAEEVAAELVPPVHNFSWVLPGELAACGRPETEQAVQFLAGEGVRSLLSLEVPPASEWLDAAGIRGHHIPVPEYGPTPFAGAQLVEAVAFIDRSLAEGRPVAVHCHGGAGRANAVVAAYLVHRGATPEAAAQTVVERRPRSVPEANLIGAARRFLAASSDADS